MATSKANKLPASIRDAAVGLQLRRGQWRYFHLVDQYRLSALLARRQYGKTTTFAAIALKKMMRKKNHTVIFGSAKLGLSREIIRKEATILQSTLDQLRKQVGITRGLLQVHDANHPDKDRDLAGLTIDDFAELFEAQRLECRFYHSRGSYSRTKIVALRPDTVGETGDLMCDEIGFVRNWREVWAAVEPIASSDPTFRICLSTTPPPDDTHYAFEMLAPPVGTEFPISADGNLYRSDLGIWGLRIDAYDAYADGVPVYDLESGRPLDPDTHRALAHDKDAWDRNYGVKFIYGGSAACSLLALDVAQRRGVGTCTLVQVHSDRDLDDALKQLPSRLGHGSVSIGVDLATTTRASSNPTAVAVAERRGVDTIVPLILVWKAADPKVATQRIRRIVEAIPKRTDGGRAKALCIDATNERYFAMSLRDELMAAIPVILFIGSETLQQHDGQKITLKQYAGSILVAELDDNHLTLPPERYLREDWRLVRKERGQFVCDPDADGRHGDTFDAVKLALYAFTLDGPTDIDVIRASTLPQSWGGKLDHAGVLV